MTGDILKQIGQWCLKKITEAVGAPRAVAAICMILIATCIYIFSIKSYVYIPGSDVSLLLGQFERCKITFKDDVYLKTYGISQYQLSNTEGSTSKILVQPLDYQGSTLIITNLWFLQQRIAANKFPAFRVYIKTQSSTKCEITSVSIDDETVSLKNFIKHNLENKKFEFVRVRYIRMDIAKIINQWNDRVSNWILTILAAGIGLFMVLLFNMECRTFISDKRFLKELEKILKMKIGFKPEAIQQQIAYDRFHDFCIQWNSRFVFLQALGPALGFILTVSSLIASLDPATLSGAGTDIDTFLNGIHIAMVSTFLGLLLRLLALEAARVNLVLLRRAYVTFSVDELPGGQEGGPC